ncbi:MAG: hypothetical protein C5B52_01650 [Bacteroidetes bacterium]|nr:MAG: hypothetical protein C5B52_01650 [Bacteroidota bacterium]
MAMVRIKPLKRIILVSFYICIHLNLSAQKHLVGHYYNAFGTEIFLNSDSTFKFTYRICFEYTWSKGEWAMKNDTIYFHTNPIFDTISNIPPAIFDKTNNTPPSKALAVDGLFLSINEAPEKFTWEQFKGMSLSTARQDSSLFPSKLYSKRQKLYMIRNGKIVSKKIQGPGGKKNWPTWFIKRKA